MPATLKSRTLALLILATVLAAGCVDTPDAAAIRALAAESQAFALDAAAAQDPARVRLGQSLFFDPILSGNRDISCATCHHPITRTSDELAVSIGTGGTGLGADRELGYGRGLVPRNSPDVFNKGSKEWTTMFWDLRIMRTQDSMITPAGPWLPSSLETLLEAQAMFPVTSREEMRGDRGDRDIFGAENELAAIFDSQIPQIWDALMVRLTAIDEYVELFKAAYPDVAVEELGFEHAAKALAAFQIEAFHLDDSPYDRFIKGDDRALTAQQKRGARLFFGKAGCASCHSGRLFTDQVPRNIGVMQIGEGKVPFRPYDIGFAAISGIPSDRFKFRTPSLRNVYLTAPYMHNGAYADLRSAIRHHFDPRKALEEYDPSTLAPSVRGLVRNAEEEREMVLKNLDPGLEEVSALDDDELTDLIAFLGSLTADAANHREDWLLETVPSGLPVDDFGQ